MDEKKMGRPVELDGGHVRTTCTLSRRIRAATDQHVKDLLRQNQMNPDVKKVNRSTVVRDALAAYLPPQAYRFLDDQS